MEGTISYLREMLEAVEVERQLKTDALRSIEKISQEWGLQLEYQLSLTIFWGLPEKFWLAQFSKL